MGANSARSICHVPMVVNASGSGPVRGSERWCEAGLRHPQLPRADVDNLYGPDVGSIVSAPAQTGFGERWVEIRRNGGIVKRGSRLALALLGAAALTAGLTACGSSSSSTTGGSATSTSGGAGTGTATVTPDVTLRLGYVTTAQHPYGISIGKYKAAVEAASGGKIAINPIPGASGANDVTLLDDVSGGSIEAAAVSTAVWGAKGVKVFQPLQAAFLITNYPLAEEVLGGSIGQSMLADPNGPPKLGLVGLGLLEGGIRKPMGAKAALVSPATFKGKKWRAPASANMVAALKAMGASPVAIRARRRLVRPGKRDGRRARHELRTRRDAEVVRERQVPHQRCQPVAVPGRGCHQQGGVGQADVRTAGRPSPPPGRTSRRTPSRAFTLTRRPPRRTSCRCCATTA